LSAKTENLYPAPLTHVDEPGGITPDGAEPSRKTFVEPEVSFPVDVLEATTFFQFTESGVTN
jgi:hypothetical protein